LIYTVKRINLIAEQLNKFSDADSWIVAGQFSNLEFWLNEVKSALNGVDEHELRFKKIVEAQKEYTKSKNIHIPDNCGICGGICELGTGVRKPGLPIRRKQTKTEKKESRIELVDATYFFLLRCYKLDLLSKDELKSRCDEIGTSVDLSDL
jgi:hypothetical protein